MKDFLTKEQRSNLLSWHHTESDRKKADRIKSVLLRDQGWNYQSIANALFIDYESARRHVQEYIESQKLENKSGGSSGNLTRAQKLELINHIENNTYLRGADICIYVFEKYGVSYTSSGMQKWLVTNGFSYKQPHGSPSKADPVKQLAFKEFYNQLKTGLSSDEIILFGDGVHPSMQTKLSHGWIKKGCNKEMPTTASRTRVNILGAINLETMDVYSEDYKTLDADNTSDFLEKLKKRIQDRKIHLFLDNGPSNQNKKVKLKAKELGIKVHYLPTYSPNCNPIERLWKIMNKVVRNNVFFNSAKEFRDKIKEFFDITWDKIKSQYSSWITDKFYINKKSVF